MKLTDFEQVKATDNALDFMNSKYPLLPDEVGRWEEPMLKEFDERKAYEGRLIWQEREGKKPYRIKATIEITMPADYDMDVLAAWCRVDAQCRALDVLDFSIKSILVE